MPLWIYTRLQCFVSITINFFELAGVTRIQENAVSFIQQKGLLLLTPAVICRICYILKAFSIKLHTVVEYDFSNSDDQTKLLDI